MDFIKNAFKVFKSFHKNYQEISLSIDGLFYKEIFKVKAREDFLIHFLSI